MKVAGATTPTIHQLATWATSSMAVKVPAILSHRRVSADRPQPVNSNTAVDNNKLVGTKTAQMATQWQRDR
jgi:hypothetical protein